MYWIKWTQFSLLIYQDKVYCESREHIYQFIYKDKYIKKILKQVNTFPYSYIKISELNQVNTFPYSYIKVSVLNQVNTFPYFIYKDKCTESSEHISIYTYIKISVLNQVNTFPYSYIKISVLNQVNTFPYSCI